MSMSAQTVRPACFFPLSLLLVLLFSAHAPTVHQQKPTEMSIPSPQEMEESLQAIANRAPVKRRDFNNICWKFIQQQEQLGLLSTLLEDNKEFGETVIIFSKRLGQAADSPSESATLIDHMYRHYVINTKGPIPLLSRDVKAADVDDHFDVFAEATAYAKILSVGVEPGAGGTSILVINGRKIPCPSWGVLPGKSAAYSLRQVGPVINKVRYGRADVIPSSVFDFNENARLHTLENAMILADFSHLAYLNPDFIQAQAEDWGYRHFEWIEDEKTDTQSFVVSKDNHIVVCFRGTGSGTDWITDAKLFKTNSSDNQGRVHSGFKSSLDAVWSRIERKINTFGDDKKIFFTGHSLGAALAQLAAYRQASTDARRIGGVYVFGSPRVGNQDYKAAYDKRLLSKTFLHINNKDLVPKVPPRILGYRHLGKLPRRFDLGHEISSHSEAELVGAREVDRIDQLDPQTQAAVRADLRDASESVAASTDFLRLDPNESPSFDYSTSFNSGLVDDHGMDQYLFKFACAIVDEEFKRISGKR